MELSGNINILEVGRKVEQFRDKEKESIVVENASLVKFDSNRGILKYKKSDGREGFIVVGNRSFKVESL